MKVTIFLDIDGVLTTVHSEYNTEGIEFDSQAVRWLKRLLREFDSEIVVSSAWRESYFLLGRVCKLLII